MQRRDPTSSLIRPAPPADTSTMKRSTGVRLLVVCLLGGSAWPGHTAEPPTIDAEGVAHAGGHVTPNVVVWLDAPNAPREPQTAKVVLDQRNLSFYPHVLAVRVGTTVDFPNDDRVFHNVFSFRDGKRFDLGLYPVGALRHVTFDQPGLSRIFCNIHANMAAYVMAVDSPYFAVSNESGAFKIPAVAIRDAYSYHAWRAGSTELSGRWTPASAPTLAIDWP
jgi:plastocyanin